MQRTYKPTARNLRNSQFAEFATCCSSLLAVCLQFGLFGPVCVCTVEQVFSQLYGSETGWEGSISLGGSKKKNDREKVQRSKGNLMSFRIETLHAGDRENKSGADIST